MDWTSEPVLEGGDGTSDVCRVYGSQLIPTGGSQVVDVETAVYEEAQESRGEKVIR